MSERKNERLPEREAVRTTIVGGRPPGPGKDNGAIPRGIEVLVKKASVDGEFRGRLLTQRARAADEIDLILAPPEVTMLNMIPVEQLERIIAATKVPEFQRLAFMGKAAAAMLVALGLTGAGCDQSVQHTRGIQPDQVGTPASSSVTSPASATASATNTPPAPRQSPVSKGVRPDRVEVTLGIR